MIFYLHVVDKTFTRFLEVVDDEFRARFRPLSYRDLWAQPTLDRGTYVFTDCGAAVPDERVAAGAVWTALEGVQGRERLFNNPATVALRHDLLERMHREGDNQFRSYRSHQVPSDIRYPVFVRPVDGELLGEERAYLSQNPHRPQLERIFRSADIDYGRIDYSLLQGRIQVWEINLNPTVLPAAGNARDARADVHARFGIELRAALMAVDDVPSGYPAEPIPMPERVRTHPPRSAPIGRRALRRVIRRPRPRRAARVLSEMVPVPVLVAAGRLWRRRMLR